MVTVILPIVIYKYEDPALYVWALPCVKLLMAGCQKVASSIPAEEMNYIILCKRGKAIDVFSDVFPLTCAPLNTSVAMKE